MATKSIRIMRNLIPSFLLRNGGRERLVEQSAPSSGYRPKDPIPTTSSDSIPTTSSNRIPGMMVVPLAGLAAGAVSFFGAPLVLGALGFQTAGITAGSVAASLQSTLYAGAVPAGSWFSILQSAGATGVVITQGAAATIGTISSAATYYWYATDNHPSEEEESQHLQCQESQTELLRT